jgi:uncharacterized protein YutE (UPF0331/DUF86 family)
MIDDVILNKIEIIKRCIRRAKEEYDGNPKNLENYTKQDSVTLNIQRACEAVIDLGMHIIAEKGLGIPQTSRDAFEILQDNRIITPEMCERLKAMIGERPEGFAVFYRCYFENIRKVMHRKERC